MLTQVCHSGAAGGATASHRGRRRRARLGPVPGRRHQTRSGRGEPQLGVRHSDPSDPARTGPGEDRTAGPRDGSGGVNAAYLAELVGVSDLVVTMDIDAEVTARATA